MKFKFKKKDFKEISIFKSLSHFLSLYEFGIFTYQKLWAGKDGKFRLPIMKAWYFPYKIIF